MFEEQFSLNSVRVLHNGVLEIQYIYSVLKDGEIISSKYLRKTIGPGTDVSNEDQTIQDIASVVWTPEVIEDYQELLAQESQGLT